MKNKFLTSALNVFRSGCVIFTAVVFGFYILGDIMSSATQVLTLRNLFLLFLFSVWFAMSNGFLKSKKMNQVVKITLHFLSTTIGFFIIFVYLPGNVETPSKAFVLTLAFVAVYAIITTVILLIKAALNKKKNETEKYDTVYEKEENE